MYCFPIGQKVICHNWKSFPEGKYKDMADASSNGFAELTKRQYSYCTTASYFADRDRENGWI